MSRTAFQPGKIGTLTLPNRFIKTATYEGMSPVGRVSDALIAYHRTMAKNRVALTTVAYAAVSPEGRTFSEQLLIDAENMSGLRRLSDAVHAEGGKVSIQLGHCGGFSKHKNSNGRAPAGPSAAFNTYGLMFGLPRIRAMNGDDLAEIPRVFALAAERVQAAGFDAIEVHCGHGYLLSQFLSPAINRRKDEWGGDLEGRLRLPLAVIAAIRKTVGPDFPIVAKINTADAVSGGLELSEAIEIAERLVASGVDALVPSGGLVSKSPFYLLRGQVPVKAMVEAETHPAQRLAIRMFAPLLMKKFEYTPNFFFDEALQIAQAVDVPVALLGGVDSAIAVERAMDAGFGFVAMGRALLADPDFIVRMEAGENLTSRCTHCNDCIGEMDKNGVRCVLDD